MKKHILLLLSIAYGNAANAQSTVISPDSQQGGIYSKRSAALNPFIALPAYVLPDSGIGTRMMWIPERSAFRAGTAFSTEWNANNIGPYSFASGLNLLASGSISAAFGYQNTASGFHSFVAGFNNKVLSTQSFSFGANNQSQGTASGTLGSNNKTELGSGASMAIGLNNQVKNGVSMAIGVGNASSAVNSFTFGIDNNASGQKSVALGNSASSNGFSSIAIGTSTIARGDYSQAFGLANETIGTVSAAMGQGNIVRGETGILIGRNLLSNIRECVVVGTHNDSVSTNPNSPGSFLAADPVFMVGNGTGIDTRSNAMTVLKNGRVGIGTSIPSQLLDVNGSARFRSVTTDNANTVFLSIETDGTIKRTTPTISDAWLKQNIVTLKNPLEKIMQLRGVGYEFIATPDQKRMGFIAQEVEKVYPEAIFEIEQGGLKGVRYDDLIPVLLEAIKAQQKQIETLQRQMTEISAKAQP